MYNSPIVVGDEDLNILQFIVCRKIHIPFDEIYRTLYIADFNPFSMQRKNTYRAYLAIV